MFGLIRVLGLWLAVDELFGGFGCLRVGFAGVI